MGSLLRRAHFELLRAAEAKVPFSPVHYGKYCTRGVVSCFIGSRPHPRAIFAVMHSHGTLTSMYMYIYGGGT